MEYTEQLKKSSEFRRALCTACGTKYLYNQRVYRLETWRHRVCNVWYSYYGQNQSDRSFRFFKSPCCKQPIARTRLSVGDEFKRFVG